MATLPKMKISVIGEKCKMTGEKLNPHNDYMKNRKNENENEKYGI